MIAATWERFCADYIPGSYGRDIASSDHNDLQETADEIERMLARALCILDDPHYRRPARQPISGEETSMGRCYGDAA